VAVRLRGVRLLPGSPPLDLDLHAGQVTGVAGLLGAGKSELAHGLFGSASWHGGTAELGGRPHAPRSPAAAVRAGVHLVPEDRGRQALLPGWSVARTLSLPFLRTLTRGGVVDRSAEAAAARTAVDRFGVVTRSERTDVGELSGGNQQKVVVGRWLVPGVRLLLLDEPFRGVDLGARRDIGRQAREAAAAGAAVVVLSADVDEVLEVADRVVVLVDGAVTLDAAVPAVPREAVVAAFSATTPGGTRP
jgi:simple sugar transport system ATP-binding protein